MKRQPGSAAWRRIERRPLPPGAVAAFSGSVALASAGQADRSGEPPLGVAQQPLSLVDRGQQIVSVGSRKPLGDVADPAAVLVDVVGDGGQFGGGRFDGRGHLGTVPVAARNAPRPEMVPSVGFAA